MELVQLAAPASKSVRLLSRGNNKLGSAIHKFDIPAGETCPGQTAICALVCYAKTGVYKAFPKSISPGLQRNFAASRRDDFISRILTDIDEEDAQIVRVHASGDFYSPNYLEKWNEIARQRTMVQFYSYSRSWRVPAIQPGLVTQSKLPNWVSYWSCDAESGLPNPRPARIRIAWLQTKLDEPIPEGVDLVFRTRTIRGKDPLPGTPEVCPHEMPGPISERPTCGQCGICWS
jgi:hypothetical protein